ncbi:HAMP domain-containing histidine kinase [Pedobacter changchengzhani]|uniref:histidine kinase n=1 Tax=Pedobacter changchengzhani TaxID=2529274 RepID=A0A4R5MK31_9SPHI|nr:HAMP domain-containing sensor histidine kinase [Pedobacter changchengzhani]TDG35981.1 HAMP domain-containing histidine kinase [Pedobacter changchengzhani]
MKKLLNKTLRTFAIYSLFVLATSVPAYYYVVDFIWLNELDEHNEIIAHRIENGLNKLNLSQAELDQSIILWNKVQPGSNLEKAVNTSNTKPQIYTISKQKPFSNVNNLGRFRCLKKNIEIQKEPFILTIETNVEETEETVVAIAIITFLFFILLVAGFLFLNRRLSVRLWKPFRDTLAKLKTFNLNNQSIITFEKTDTFEFEELNDALTKLLQHNISVYNSQKEFTENASHELQTPLAIIKNKLDLLIQNETITARQYQIIEEINRALTRITRINKNLLLLAKIENKQFNAHENINFSHLAKSCINQLKEHSDNKQIAVQINIAPDVIVDGNRTLIEMLLNNLLLNAIRHNTQNGTITIAVNHHQLIVSNSGSKALKNDALFKRFANSSNEKFGSGLGLAIIKQICIRHQWAIGYHFDGSEHQFTIQF